MSKMSELDIEAEEQKEQKLNLDKIIGKTIKTTGYHAHSAVALEFDDGTYLLIKQPMQAGALNTYYLEDCVAYKVNADDEED